MYLDQRSKIILEELIKNPNISCKELEVKLSLSRGQIKYSVEKINNWLEANEYPKIKRLNNGKFLINPLLSEVMLNDQISEVKHYLPTEKERELLILFILLSQTDLSLVHFTSALKVSNVTIVSDMKKAKESIKDYGLEIEYSRLNGYRLVGEEWNKRNLLFDVIQEIRDGYGGLGLIRDFALVNEEKILEIHDQLVKIEEFLNIKFSDEKIQLLPYYIGIIFKRVRRGEHINFDYHIQYKELSDTKEYEATEFLVKDEKDFPEVERLYITLQLLATNIISGDMLTEDEIPNLKQALSESLRLFEMNAFLELKNKDYLIERMMLHLKPAYYRIKYNLSNINRIRLELDKAFIEVDHIVKKSLGPLEAFMQQPIPDDERFYFTLFIGGHLIETKQVLTTRKKAVVVCRNGITVSKLLRNTLTKLFPEFDFYPTMSVREINENAPIDAAVVFTPEPIKLDTEVFIIKTVLTNQDKQNLRNRVMKRIFGMQPETIDFEQLLNVIEKSANIFDRGRLLRELQQFLLPQKNADYQNYNDSNPNLSDLLTIDMITILEDVSDWKEAIRVASIPLLERAAIQECYVEKMIELHDYNQPYMLLGTKMAIPHASPENGVNKLGMSMLIVKNGVMFSPNYKVHIVVVIAPLDAEQHVKAIYQLSNLATNEGAINQILEQDNQEAIVQILRDIPISVEIT